MPAGDQRPPERDPLSSDIDHLRAGGRPRASGGDPEDFGTDPIAWSADPLPSGVDPLHAGRRPHPSGGDPRDFGTDPIGPPLDPQTPGACPHKWGEHQQRIEEFCVQGAEALAPLMNGRHADTFSFRQVEAEVLDKQHPERRAVGELALF